MSNLPWLMAVVGLVLGLVLPIETVWALIQLGAIIVIGLSALLVALVAARPGRWAFAWRGRRGFIAVGVVA